jgi:chemosensory pili system protein ChpA (sensor histidine kinase/response regulator)
MQTLKAHQSKTLACAGTTSEQEIFLMSKNNDTRALILVVEDVHEIRDGMEKLLTADGYRVSLARDEHDAVDNARVKRPDLILVSLAGSPTEVATAASRIREVTPMGQNVPVVIFCGGGITEGDELAIGQNTYLTRPDNFNQLRSLLARLLHQELVA